MCPLFINNKTDFLKLTNLYVKKMQLNFKIIENHLTCIDH